MKRDILIILGTFVGSIAAIGLLLLLSLPYPNKVPIAVYHQMVATVSHGKVTDLTVGREVGEPGGKSNIHVRIGQTRIVPILEMSQLDADALPLVREVGHLPNGKVVVSYESGGWTVLEYDADKLQFAVFRAHTPIQLAPGPNGPFFTLPITKQRMYELFGKPVCWERTRVMGY